MNFFPQKSFAALGKSGYSVRSGRGSKSGNIAYNLTARFGASRSSGGTKPDGGCSKDVDENHNNIILPLYNLPTLNRVFSLGQSKSIGSLPFLADDRSESTDHAMLAFPGLQLHTRFDLQSHIPCPKLDT